MIPYVLIVDDFLPEFVAVRRFIEQGAKFVDQHNPVDGLTYPGICEVDIGSGIGPLVAQRLASIMGSRVALKTLVLRLSLKGAPQPYHAHSDAFMGGQYTAVCYLNYLEQCRGGTQFLRHKRTGIEFVADSGPLHEDLMRDADDPNAWDVVLDIPMQPNRIVIFPSYVIHRAEPAEGFGTDANDGRVVMVAVFDLVRA